MGYLELLKLRLHQNEEEEAKMSDAEKKALNEDRQVAREVLYTCLDWAFRLMHPLLPYLTEELYQRLPPSPQKFDSIVVATYPTHVMAWFNDTIENEMEIISEVATKLRSQKQSLGMAQSAKPQAYVRHADPEVSQCLTRLSKPLGRMGLCGEVSVLAPSASEPKGVIRDVVNDKCLIFMSAEGVDLTKELEKLKKKSENAKKMVESYETKMSDPNYETKVPEPVRKTNTEKLEKSRIEFEELQRAVAGIQAAMK